MRGRRFAGAGLMRRGGREPDSSKLSFSAWAAQTKAGLDAIEAGSALHAWLPEYAVTTFNGSAISAISDLWGTANMAQGVVANQPDWHASHGPNGRPHIHLGSGSNKYLEAVLPTYAAGNRLCLYAVVICPLSAGSVCDLYSAAVADGVHFYVNGTDFALYIDFNVGDSFNAALTSPAHNALHNLRALRPLASGSLSQFNGTTTTPNPAGDGLIEIDRASIGSKGVNFSGGMLAGMFIINNSTASKDTYFRARLETWFGVLPQ